MNPGGEAPKVFVLGIDGGTWDLVLPWVQEGRLPHFKRFLEEGSHGPLRTTLPPLTPSAWTSFMTGTTPAKHGILDFYTLGEDHRVRVSRRSPDLKTIWRRLSEAGRRVISVAVPFTYPPEPVRGIMVSDFLTPSLESRFTYPASFREELLKRIPGYRLSEDRKYSEREEDREAYAESIFSLLEVQFETLRWLAGEKPWDIFMITLMAADHAQHWYWKYMDERHPGWNERDAARFGDVIYRVYRRIDDILGYLMENLPPHTHLFLMSDHGAGPYYGAVYLNNFLRREGLLRLKRSLPNAGKQLMYLMNLSPQSLARLALKLGMGRRMAGFREEKRKKLASRLGFTYEDIDWGRTRAYSFGYYGPVYLLARDRRERARLEEEVRAALSELRDPVRGGPLVTGVWRGEELYGRTEPGRFPDLVLSLGDFSYTSSVFAFPTNRIFADSMTFKSGEHRLDGLFGARGPGIRAGARIDDATITDVAPTIAALFGLPPDPACDGRALESIRE